MYIKRTTTVLLGAFFFTLIVYLEYFDHPPAAETLATNLKNNDVGEQPNSPHFHRLGLGASSSDGKSTMEEDVAANVGRALRSSNTSGASHFSSDSSNKEHNDHEDGDLSYRDSMMSVNSEREEGSINDTVKRPGIRGDTKIAEEAAPSPRRFPTEDWDKWVKNHHFVEIGTIWADCDNPDPHTIGKITLESDKEQGGLKYNMDFNTTIGETIEFGSITFSVELDGVPFATKHYDICDAAIKWEWDGFRCPINPGYLTFHYEKHIPGYVPSGNYYIESKTTDQLDNTVLCGQATIAL